MNGDKQNVYTVFIDAMSLGAENPVLIKVIKDLKDIDEMSYGKLIGYYDGLRQTSR